MRFVDPPLPACCVRLLAVWFLVFIQPCSERSEHSCGLMALCALGARDLDSLLRNCERFGGGHLSDYWPKRRSRRGRIGSSKCCLTWILMGVVLTNPSHMNGTTGRIRGVLLPMWNECSTAYPFLILGGGG